MHPVGPRTPRIYWVRRVAVIVAAVAVLVGVIFVIAGRSRAAGNASGVVTASPSGSSTALTGVLAANSAAGALAVGSSGAAASGANGPVTGAPLTSGLPVSSSVSTTPSATPASPARTTAKTAAAAKTPAVTTTGSTSTTGKTTAGKTTPAPTGGSKTVTTAPKVTTAAGTTAPATTGVKTTPAKPAPTKTTPAKPTSSAPPAPTTDAQGRLLCSDSMLKLVATTGAPSYATGDQPALGVSVRNIGSVACTRDLSGPLQVFSVYTQAGNRVWSTADCFPGIGTDVRTLPAGTTVSYLVKWSGTSSSPGCSAARAQVPAGRYQVRVEIGSLHATPAALTIS